MNTLQEKKFYIQKQPKEGKVKYVRINRPEDIPTELANTVKFNNGELKMENAECHATCPAGMIIGYEESTKTESGFGAWPVQDESRVMEINGKLLSQDKIAKKAWKIFRAFFI